MPTEVYNSSIILTHWGRTDTSHTSNTAFMADNYSSEWIGSNIFPPGVKQDRWTYLYEGHPCYTPGKVRYNRPVVCCGGHAGVDF